MNIYTHIVPKEGTACEVCGMHIPPPSPSDERGPNAPGESVGVIPTRYVPPVSYRVGKHDSNPRCSQK